MNDNSKQPQEIIEALHQSTKTIQTMTANLRLLIEWLEQQEIRNLATIRADNEKRKQFLKVFGDLFNNPDQE